MRRATRRPPARPRTVVAVVAGLGVVPWSVQLFTTGEFFLRFAWGGVSVAPAITLAPLWIYPAQTPLVARWLVATACWVAALAGAFAGLVGREDRRLTAGLLAVAAVVNLAVAVSFSVQPGRVAVPTGSVAALAVAGWRLTRAA